MIVFLLDELIDNPEINLKQLKLKTINLISELKISNKKNNDNRNNNNSLIEKFIIEDILTEDQTNIRELKKQAKKLIDQSYYFKLGETNFYNLSLSKSLNL